MGEPNYLSAKQVEQLQEASKLVKKMHPWKCETQSIHLDIELPAQSVAAITVEFTPWQ